MKSKATLIATALLCQNLAYANAVYNFNFYNQAPGEGVVPNQLPFSKLQESSNGTALPVDSVNSAAVPVIPELREELKVEKKRSSRNYKFQIGMNMGVVPFDSDEMNTSSVDFGLRWIKDATYAGISIGAERSEFLGGKDSLNDFEINEAYIQLTGGYEGKSMYFKPFAEIGIRWSHFESDYMTHKEENKFNFHAATGLRFALGVSNIDLALRGRSIPSHIMQGTLDQGQNDFNLLVSTNLSVKFLF